MYVNIAVLKRYTSSKAFTLMPPLVQVHRHACTLLKGWLLSNRLHGSKEQGVFISYPTALCLTAPNGELHFCHSTQHYRQDTGEPDSVLLRLLFFSCWFIPVELEINSSLALNNVYRCFVNDALSLWHCALSPLQKSCNKTPLHEGFNVQDISWWLKM